MLAQMSGRQAAEFHTTLDKAMKALFKTNDEFAPLILRLLLGVVMFPHGAQKALGWFGGHGFAGTMHHFTENMHIPALLAFLVILAEFGGSLALLAGLFSRVAAFGIGAVMLAAALMVHWQFGFFMNWFGQQKGEGIEYHLLALAVALAVMITGGGKWSLDALICLKCCPPESSSPTS